MSNQTTSRKKISIHDIARQLNVSSTTVSFVLNGKAEEKRISDEMKKKILDHVAEVGYQPNQVAKSLRTGKSKIIGMLVEDISDPFFSGISRLVEENLYKHGYKIFFSSTENNTEKTKVLLNVLRERQVDGYIIAPPPGIETEIEALLDDRCPMVLFDRYFPDLNTINVVVDNFGGARMAIDHLYENGYRKIGLVTLDSEQSQMKERLAGYYDAVERKELPSIIEKVTYRQTQEETVNQIKGFLLQHGDLDAVLFATNYLTIPGLEAIIDLELSIPDDIAVVGFDDNNHFSLFSPSITAVAQPIEKLSEKTVKRLVSCLAKEKESYKSETEVLPTTLIIRNSSLPRNNS
jgi:LacI family transcriptional regulator